MRTQKAESGEIMLEAAIVFIPVLVLVMCLLSLGFFFYQTALINTVAADIADTAAENVKFTNLEPNEETLEVSDFQNLKLFRALFGAGSLGKAQQESAQRFADWRIPLSTLGFGDQKPEVTVKVQMSGPGRSYVEAKISLETDIFLGGVLRFAGILDEDDRYAAVAYAECVDLTGYTSTLNFAEYATKALEVFDPVGELYENGSDLLDGIKDLFKKVIEF